MNKLYAFGDSFTWGTDLVDEIGYGNYIRSDYLLHKQQFPDSNEDRTKLGHSQQTWTALMSRHLDLEYVCYAVPGSSNFTIVRDFISKVDEFNSSDFVVINWTWIDRWDFFNVVDNEWNTLQASSTHNEISKLYYKYLHSELWNKFETLKQILLVAGVLKSNNIQFMMTCIDPLAFDKKFHSPKYITQIQKQVNEYILWFDEMGFYDWAVQNNFEISKTGGHPLETAHLNAFKYIIQNYDIA